jgi:hypothetical protein
MAGLCDFFIAPRDAIVDRNLADGPQREFPTVVGGSLDPVALTALEERLTGAPGWQIKQNVISEGDGWWVLELSHSLAAALAVVNPESSEEYADKWQLSANEEDLVDGLGALARQALEEKKTMFAWISL